MYDFFIRLRKERERLGLTQGDFGQQCGVTKLSQSNYEAGKRKPDIEYLNNAENIGCDTHFIVTGNRATLNSKALQECIEIIEEVSQETGRIFSPEQKAKLLVILYEDYITDAASITPEKINTYIRLVA